VSLFTLLVGLLAQPLTWDAERPRKEKQ
jgi:hypothetical protein